MGVGGKRTPTRCSLTSTYTPLHTGSIVNECRDGKQLSNYKCLPPTKPSNGGLSPPESPSRKKN
ncbi:hypothetical protein I79_015194 [Cricetulus griseus]|uniref:Uncharacterized protein n=1 Tax=Cricetulus griseus TaxID=10029 RepID=G3HW46_CRIGR|nr:hypothetical protein I79_015194 [Cricetulus griseus]